MTAFLAAIKARLARFAEFRGLVAAKASASLPINLGRFASAK
jgi:hypothetical protein